MSMTVDDNNDLEAGALAPASAALHDEVVVVDGVVKRFGSAKAPVVALDGLSLRVRHGEFVAVLGASGCGKSTLLHLMAELLASVHLNGFEAKRPHELSGGMRQRAALARALAQDAEVLLMDEPFGALDAITRDLLHTELERLWVQNNFTVVFVTHDVREAIRLADRIVVLSSRPGRVLADVPVDLDRPRRAETAAVNELAATITATLHQEVRRHAAAH